MAQINKPNTQFTPTIYSGTSASHAVSVGFQPDLVWLKPRSVADNHRLMNSVSGAGFYLMSNQTNAESPSGTRFTSFDADGFTLGDADAGWNESGQTYASWNWLAGGTASSNTDGSITSSVSANTTAGFSIVKYTGDGTNTATIGHGLGAIPSMVIMKPLDYVGAWWITQKNLSTDNVLEFNTNAQTSYSSFGGGGLRQSQYTSSIITGGAGGSNSNLWNQSGQNYIAYCFSEKKGFSKFGSYTGNGNADGTFVYTGFKPAFVIVKRYDGAGQGWNMFDNKRDPFNLVDEFLIANSSNAEATGGALNCDFLSNGFKLRGSDGGSNASGSSYIYMAFAENPLVGTNNVPATAR